MKKAVLLALLIASGCAFADEDAAAAAAAAAAVASILDDAELETTMSICGPIADEAHSIMRRRQAGASKSVLLEEAKHRPKTREMIQEAFERYKYEHPRDWDLAAEEFKNTIELRCVERRNATH